MTASLKFWENVTHRWKGIFKNFSFQWYIKSPQIPETPDGKLDKMEL
jgi:hypothetical protein